MDHKLIHNLLVDGNKGRNNSTFALSNRYNTQGTKKQLKNYQHAFDNLYSASKDITPSN